MKVLITPSERQERGLVHHPKSRELYDFISNMDFEYGNDSFCFKSGGDGDNGEFLMYYLDEYFESQEVVG